MDSCRLPYDVLHNVIQFVDWLPTLAALMRVSREVNLEVEPILWRSLNINFGDEQSMKRCAALHGNNRGRHVRQLQISYVQLVSVIRREHPPEACRHVMRLALRDTATYLESTPNVETVDLIGNRLDDYEKQELFTVLSSPTCLPRVRVAFIDQVICGDPQSTIHRMWETHPTLVATHVRQIPYKNQQTLRLVPTDFLGACPKCPPSGTAIRDGTLVPSITMDHLYRTTDLAFARSLPQLSAPPEYACFGNLTLAGVMTSVLQRLPALRTLHVAASSPRADSSQERLFVLDSISCLSKLEEFIWSEGGTIPAQEELFAQYKAGKLSSSLRRLVFGWYVGRNSHIRIYERKNLDDVAGKWSLILDDS